MTAGNELDERYTLRTDIAWALKRVGAEAFDLDVAACAESHLAAKFYTKADDGLTKPWLGWVWCNPPFSDIAPWVERAWEVINDCLGIAMLLPASRTEQQWWQRLVEPYRDGKGDQHPSGARLETHFLPGRTRFGLPGNPRGDGVGSPPFGCVLLIWRR